MPNFKVTEFDTIVSIYKVNAIDKQDAINKIANGDLITRLKYNTNYFSKSNCKKKYRAREIINGKDTQKVQTIGKTTQNKENTTSTLLQYQKRY